MLTLNTLTHNILNIILNYKLYILKCFSLIIYKDQGNESPEKELDVYHELPGPSENRKTSRKCILF